MIWVVRILQAILGIGFVGAGAFKLFGGEEAVTTAYTDTLGYGYGFMLFIGVCELVGAIGLFAGIWKRIFALLALGGLLIIMIGATVSNFNAGLTGDGVMTTGYVVVIALLGLYNWKQHTAGQKSEATA